MTTRKLHPLSDRFESPLSPMARRVYNGTSLVILLGLIAHVMVAAAPTLTTLVVLTLTGLTGSLMVEAGKDAFRWGRGEPYGPPVPARSIAPRTDERTNRRRAA